MMILIMIVMMPMLEIINATKGSNTINTEAISGKYICQLIKLKYGENLDELISELTSRSIACVTVRPL